MSLSENCCEEQPPTTTTARRDRSQLRSMPSTFAWHVCHICLAHMPGMYDRRLVAGLCSLSSFWHRSFIPRGFGKIWKTRTGWQRRKPVQRCKKSEAAEGPMRNQIHEPAPGDHRVGKRICSTTWNKNFRVCETTFALLSARGADRVLRPRFLPKRKRERAKRGGG